jgi:Cu/Zn superoxide dismutase
MSVVVAASRAAKSVPLAAAALPLVACASQAPLGGPSARAVLEPTRGNTASGTAIFVHAQPDDYRTQPTGNAGARIVCGVIQRS